MTAEYRARPLVVSDQENEEAQLRYLDISQVRTYEHNPRRAVNPEYDRIKASIRRDGVGQPLVVTQRPGQSDYVVLAGGNTRLQILQELFAETGDPQFGTVVCVVRSWTREADVLLAHLKENDLRGALNFVDKALAVAEAKSLFDKEIGTGKLTQTRFAEMLVERGYGLSHGLLSQMKYAVERLLPLVPLALNSGMGRPQVERIRQLERAALALWVERSVDTETAFDEAFSALCCRYDSPEWDIGNLRRALEAEIAERASVSIHAVSMVLEGYLAGRRGAEAGAQWIEANVDEASSCVAADASEGAAMDPVESQSAKPPAVITDNLKADERRESASNEPERDSGAISEGADNGADSEYETDALPAGDDTPWNAETHRPTDCKSLRARSWTLASRLAQRNGLSELIEPLPGKGLGFILRDVPDPVLVDQLDQDTLAQVSMVWWHLAAASEVTVAPVEHLLPALAEQSVLGRALEDQDAGLLFSSLWTLDPGQTGYRLWRRLDERDWRDLVALMETYRALHQVAEASGDPLWP